MKIRRYFSLFLSILILPLFLLGMSSRPSEKDVSQDNIKGLVLKSLTQIESAYQAKNLAAFSDILDKAYADSLGLQFSLENLFLSTKELELEFIFDSYLVDKDMVSVRCHWLKKIIDNAGVFSKEKGSSQLVFKKYFHDLKLLYFRQDNPFF